MTANQSMDLKNDHRMDALIAAYGDGGDGSSPTAKQWAALLGRDPGSPVTLVNSFKLRDRAAYGRGAADTSGQAAFDRYAAVSVPSMEAAGGKFLLVAPAAGAFCGPEEGWDLVAIGSYPDLHALLRLFEDPSYQACFHHRTAACAKQKVVVCDA